MADLETLIADTRYHAEVAAPATPSVGRVVVYAKTDGRLYIKDDTGTETDLTGGAASLAAESLFLFDNFK
jgi:hypothetical protein